MSKTCKIVLLLGLVLAAVLAVACAAGIDAVKFENNPRTVYVRGQELDFNETVLVAVTGDKTEKVSASEIKVSGYDKNTLGKQTVTFTYQDVSTTLDITVIPRIAVEGAVKDYFIGDSFDKSKGRLVVADDSGKTTTVPISDSRVTVSGFDSTAAGSEKTVTVSYGDYSDTFTVNIHNAGSVELSASPKRSTYSSHETVFDITGAYFTVKSEDGSLEKFVELNKDMISGFDPSLAKAENRKEPLKQVVKISYLGYSSDFEIYVTYSGVSMMKDCAAQLSSVSDPTSVTKEQGDAAVEAMRAYFELVSSEKSLISTKEKNAVAKVAAVYGYDSFNEALETFSATFGLVKQISLEDDDEVYGIFNIIAETYETTVSDLERLYDEDEPFVMLGALLRDIESEFGTLEVNDSKTVDQYIEILNTEEGLETVRGLLSLMTEMYGYLKDVPADWTVEGLEAYRGEIKNAVICITDSDYQPYSFLPYLQFFDKVDKWREGGDYFRIIYSYYLKYDADNAISALWEKVPMPEPLNSFYLMLRYGLSSIMDMRVGTDTSPFMYYYDQAQRLQDEIVNGDDQLLKDIYEEFGFADNVDIIFHIGDDERVNGIAYIYHVASLLGNEDFEAFMDKYLQVIADYTANGGLDFGSADVQADVREVLETYMQFTPTQRYAILCTITCEYRYTEMEDLVLNFERTDEGEIAAYNWLGYMALNAYENMLTEEAFDLFCKLFQASEMYGLRYRNEEKFESFKTTMAEAIEDAKKLKAEDMESFKFMYDELVALYDECMNPKKVDVSAYQDKIDELLRMINVYYEVLTYSNGDDLTETDRLNAVTLLFAVSERIFTLEEDLLADGNENVRYDYLHTLYTFNYEAEENVPRTLDYVMDEIRAAHNITLVRATVSALDEEGEDESYNAYRVYYSSGLSEFFNEAVDFMYAGFKQDLTGLDRISALELMNKLRTLDEDTIFAFVALSGGAYYYDALAGFLASDMTAEQQDFVMLLMITEEVYNVCYTQNNDVTVQNFITSAESLRTAYEAIADKSALADFEEMYNFYAVEKYEEIKASAEEK
ncbi:MAG: bacterial Ig-like domain-containing protein [Clostridia bacterium]|nr:bacterial Ig-like domain-containing protein [Clostridia bacterium]